MVLLDPNLCADFLPLAGKWSMQAAHVDIRALWPLLDFAVNLCACENIPDDIAVNMEGAAQAVGRSLLLSAVGSQRGQPAMSKYLMVEEYIERYYAVRGIRIVDAAKYARLSVRGLQVNLQNEGTTFGYMLRRCRSIAALRLKEQNPYLTDLQIMGKTGFGSLSSMYRGMKEFKDKAFQMQETDHSNNHM